MTLNVWFKMNGLPRATFDLFVEALQKEVLNDKIMSSGSEILPLQLVQATFYPRSTSEFDGMMDRIKRAVREVKTRMNIPDAVQMQFIATDSTTV